MLNRRQFVQVAITGTTLSLLPHSKATELSHNLESSDLIYLTPLKSNGTESRCQSEIWYVWDGTDIYVCTDTTAWRAKAPALGLKQTRIWVGDLGNWKSTNGEYKQLPRIDAVTNIVKDSVVHAKTLEMFGEKYPLGWVRWGPTFKRGLKDGSRTLLQYRPS